MFYNIEHFFKKGGLRLASNDNETKEMLAKELWLQGNKYKKIAEEIGVTESCVKSWATRKWKTDKKLQLEKKKVALETGKEKRKRGGQPGNKNGKGPPGNKHGEKHGFFSKILPAETLELVGSMEYISSIDLLWQNIQLHYAAILRAQKIMYVENKDDMSSEVSMDGEVVKYEIQYAWDKQGNFLQAQARAMGVLNGMIKQYEEMLKSSLATEEQELRIQKLKNEIAKQVEETNIDTKIVYKGIGADDIAPIFSSFHHVVASGAVSEFVLTGGRGSTKSSVISLEIIDLIEKDPKMHALITRKVANTLRDSVYQQACWAIDKLDLTSDYKTTVSPMEITKKSTGQKIFFRGLDDPLKVKSIKAPFGHIGILWFEEFDQFNGEEEIRSVEQSAIRGGDKSYVFKSFNPPKSAINWANKYIAKPGKYMLFKSSYLDVPKEWLGTPFLEKAEDLKEKNHTAYENEYLGVANGTGGNVFDNVCIETITEEQIKQFDHIYNGVDWGWYPDPYHFGRMHYDSSRMILYIFDEFRCNKHSNKQTADKLKSKGLTHQDLITCDSAEEKSIGDYRAYDLFARPTEKFPGSVGYSIKWLQSLNKIVIDNTRCPSTAKEFLEYEYERDKEGNAITSFPDKNNHAIDMVRYAMTPVWRRRGE